MRTPPAVRTVKPALKRARRSRPLLGWFVVWLIFLEVIFLRPISNGAGILSRKPETCDSTSLQGVSDTRSQAGGRTFALGTLQLALGHSATRMPGIYLIAVYSSRWCVRSSHWRRAVPSLGLGSLYPLGSDFSIRRHVGASGDDIAVSRAAAQRRRHYPSPLHTGAPFCRCCTPAPCLRPPRAAA